MIDAPLFFFFFYAAVPFILVSPDMLSFRLRYFTPDTPALFSRILLRRFITAMLSRFMIISPL